MSDDVKVKIGGDDSGLAKSIKSANKNIQSFNRNVHRGIPAITKLTAAAGLAVGSLLAIGQKASAAAAELVTFSQISNTTTTEFQRLAAGAKTVHIEQDKLADILKDVNDRVGDFLATGGGPMKDFFEQIAPKVGVTAEQFKNLSGPQALQLYYDSLEKANLGQDQMTFYLEAMASDLTQLMPLLKNNGAEFKRLGDRAEDYHRVLSEADIQSLLDTKAAFEDIGDEVKTLTSLVGVALKDEIKIFTDLITAATQKIKAMVVSFRKVKEEAKRQREVEAEINQIIGKRSIRRGRNVEYASKEAAEMDKLSKRQLELEKKINEEYKKRGGRSGRNSAAAKAAFEERKKQYQSELEAINTRIELLKRESEAARAVAELRAGLSAPSIEDTGEQASNPVEPLKTAPAITTSDEGTKTQEDEYQREQERIQAVVESFQTEQELHNEHFQVLKDLMTAYHEGQIGSLSEFNAKKALAEKAHQEKLNQLTKEGTTFRDEWEKKSFQDKAQYISRHTQGLTSLMDSENKKMFKVGKAAAKAQTIVSTYSSAQKAFDSLASIPYVGPALGAAAAAAAILAGKKRLDGINKTSFGSGASPSESATAATPAVSSPSAASSDSAGAGVPSGTLHVTGLTPQIANIAEELLEYQRNGGQVIIES